MCTLFKIKYTMLFVAMSAAITVSAFSATPEDMNSKEQFCSWSFSSATAEHQAEESKFIKEFECTDEEYEFTDEECRQFIKDNPFLRDILLPYANSVDETEEGLSPLSVADLSLSLNRKKRDRKIAFENEEIIHDIKEPTTYALPKQKPWPAQIIFKSYLTRTEYVVNFTQSAEGEPGKFKLTANIPQKESIISFRLNEDSVLTVADCLRCLKRAEMFSEIDRMNYRPELTIMGTTYASLKDMNINDNRVREHLKSYRSRVEFKFTSSVLHVGYVLTETGIKSEGSKGACVEVGGTKEIELCRLGVTGIMEVMEPRQRQRALELRQPFVSRLLEDRDCA